LGRGQETAALVERGPRDVRRTIAAFNRMNQRLQRYVSGRTNMLAAISHDLRTPITSLRLRAEFVEDSETRERMIATLDEMQQMAEATLDFAREEAAPEHTRPVDLAALLQSLCDDLAELGQEVSFGENEAPAPATLACRPVALKRALRNLIENAVRYGQRARLALQASEEGFRIEIDDDGPGIAAEALERVFEPFVRLEESRSRETGGIGLGLAIARSIVRGHGGDIALATRDEGGLRASVTLPRGAA
jgi:signal transduction histidine kinase